MPTLPPPALPDFLAPLIPFRRAAHVLQSGLDAGRRIHLIDHGDPAARPVVMLHGNPTWSFLWRKVIALLPGFRCVAPDLLGLGFSDRLPRIADHSVERHGAAMAEVVEALDLRGVVLVGQDWGGPIAAQVGARLPERTAGLVLANTAITVPDHPKGTLFHRFARVPGLSDLVFRGFGFPQNVLSRIQGDKRSIRGDVARAYRWPLRTWRDRIAPLALARMVPDGPDHPSIPALQRGAEWALSFHGPAALGNARSYSGPVPPPSGARHAGRAGHPDGGRPFPAGRSAGRAGSGDYGCCEPRLNPGGGPSAGSERPSASSGDTPAGSESPSAGRGETPAGSGATFAASGEPSADSGQAFAGAGEPPAGTGGSFTGSGGPCFGGRRVSSSSGRSTFSAQSPPAAPGGRPRDRGRRAIEELAKR